MSILQWRQPEQVRVVWDGAMAEEKLHHLHEVRPKLEGRLPTCDMKRRVGVHVSCVWVCAIAKKQCHRRSTTSLRRFVQRRIDRPVIATLKVGPCGMLQQQLCHFVARVTLGHASLDGEMQRSAAAAMSIHILHVTMEKKLERPHVLPANGLVDAVGMSATVATEECQGEQGERAPQEGRLDVILEPLLQHHRT